MTTSTVLITDMALLVGIFLLGFLAKMFPRKAGNEGTSEQATPSSTNRSLGTPARNTPEQ